MILIFATLRTIVSYLRYASNDFFIIHNYFCLCKLSFIVRTDTLLRTQTITQKERYIPPFYRFCTISFVSFVSFVTITFSIHLLLRYLKIRSPRA